MQGEILSLPRKKKNEALKQILCKLCKFSQNLFAVFSLKGTESPGCEESSLTGEGPSGPATPMLLSGISCWPCVSGSPVEVSIWSVSMRESASSQP